MKPIQDLTLFIKHMAKAAKQIPIECAEQAVDKAISDGFLDKNKREEEIAKLTKCNPIYIY